MEVAFVVKDTKKDTYGGHPVHRGWAEEIDADYIVTNKTFFGSLESLVPSKIYSAVQSRIEADYDVYVFENPDCLYALPWINQKSPDSIKIYLETNWRRHPWASGTEEKNLITTTIKRINTLADSFMLNFFLNNYIDGFLTVSKLFAEELRVKFGKPVGLIRPYIFDSVSSNLDKKDPELRRKSAVVICEGRTHKGVDRLVSRWSKVKKAHPDAELYIVGKNHSDWYREYKGVSVEGYVDNLIDVFAKTSLAIHPARLDAFPVSTLETMYYGLPTIVTETTGTKEVIPDRYQQLVCENVGNKIINTVLWYFSTTITEREHMSNAVSKSVQKYVQSELNGSFKKSLNNVLDTVESSKY